MTDEFKKARDKFSTKKFKEMSRGMGGIEFVHAFELGILEGADWAYEWCQKDNTEWALEAAKWKNEFKAMNRLREMDIELLNKVYKEADLLAEALENLFKYKWEGNGPSGCDAHGIDHPCGPCRFETTYGRGGYIAKALTRYRKFRGEE